MNKQTIRDIRVRGKRVLVRVDFNVPMDENTQIIGDDSRIRAALPTIHHLMGNGARIILCSHLGRPDGKVVESMRLGAVAKRLSQIIGKHVKYVTDCIGEDVKQAVAELRDGEIMLLENLRFYEEEEANDPIFARALASLADIYVDDAFGTAHRKHASIVGVAAHLPSVAGFLMEQELQYMGGILKDPAHPFGGLFGGAKVSDKVSLLENIMGKVDYLLIGGGMAATFLKANGVNVGKSFVEQDRLDIAVKLMKKAENNGARLIFPVDAVVATEISPDSKALNVDITEIPPDCMILDIGEKTVALFSETLEKCRTVFWNGTMGVAEIPQFANGTTSMANLLAGLDASTIIGGGSTGETVQKMGLADKMTFVSTGGGASLMLLGGQKLPGVEALSDKI